MLPLRGWQSGAARAAGRRRWGLSPPAGGATVGREFSKSTSIPKKLLRVRDHGFDGYMEVQKKVRRALKLQELILSHPGGAAPVSQLDALARRHAAFGPFEAGSFLLKHPHVFHIYEHPVQRVLWVRLTPRAARQLQEEAAAVQEMLPDATLRLRKLLLLSNSGRLRLEHVRVARRDLGLPDDFEYSVVLANPRFFRLVGGDERRSKYIEAAGAAEGDGNDDLRVCAIERSREREYRERGGDAEDMRFSFLVRFPPGFKIGKYFRIAMWKWQRVPYWSPYEDVSGYDLRSMEAQRRMEKRAVATIHELLSLTVERKTTLERIAHFRQAMDLPQKLKEFLLRHQGIFYVSTRGNQGKLHTVFLREAYWKGEMAEPNPVHLARRKLAELLLTSPKDVNLDRMLTSLGRGWGGGRQTGGMECLPRDGHGVSEEEDGSDSAVESEFAE